MSSTDTRARPAGTLRTVPAEHRPSIHPPVTPQQREDDVLAAAAYAFALYGQDHTHDPGLSVSSAVGCTRRAAHLLAETEPSDDPGEHDDKRAAVIGTMLHQEYLPYLAKALNRLYAARGLNLYNVAAVAEEPVTVTHAGITVHGERGLRVPGRADLWHHGDVLDLKTGQQRTFTDRRQTWFYAAGFTQSGRPVATTTLLYLDLGPSKSLTVLTEPFGPEQMAWVMDRMETVALWAQTPDHAPRDYPGPGLSIICDGCEFMRRCWGPDAQRGRTGAQRRLAVADAEIEAAAEAYATESAKTAHHKARKDLFAAVLRGRPKRTYGDWEVSTGADKLVDDVELLRAFWLEHHDTLPKKPQRGALSVIPKRADRTGSQTADTAS